MGDFKRKYLKTSDNNGNEYKRNSVLEFILKFLWIFFKLFLVYLILRLLLVGVIRTTNIGTENRINLNNIPAPVQTGTSGGTSKVINDGTANISYVANYVINGRVVDTQNYSSSGIENKLAPKDVGLAWGFLSTDESQEKITWSSWGDRFLNWRVKDDDWYKSVGGKVAMTSNHSNNHLIPSSNEIERKIQTIKKGDYVQIEGYLVDIKWTGSNGRYFYWNTSTSRSDDGSGACEIIYVTDITWLR